MRAYPFSEYCPDSDSNMCAKREETISTKKKRKSLSLGDKLEVLKRYDAGRKGVQIARELGIAATTVITIRNNKEKILASAKSATSLSALIVNRSRSATMEKMEQQLSHWIEEQRHKNLPLSMMLIQERARNIFQELKSTQEDTAAPDSFSASSGWFDRFKRRFNISLSTSGVATNADFEAADNFISYIQKLIEEEKYTYKQIFNVDETGLYWKHVPYKMTKSATTTKAAKEKLTILVGGNAEGDCKIKPLVVYHTENPRALKEYTKTELRVSWCANRNARITSTVFSDWFVNDAVPFWKEYCLKEELPFKILLIIDNAANYPTNLDELHPNVRIIRMPPNTTTLLQPMNQGAIATFKTFYHRRMFAVLTNENGGSNPSEFWQNVTIYNGINLIADSWDELSQQCMNGVWRKLIPECVLDNMDVPQVECDIVTLDKQDDYEMEEEHEQKSEELEPILEYKQEEIETSPQVFKDRLSEYLKMIDKAQHFIKEHDPHVYRSASVSRMVLQAINPYKELYKETITKSKLSKSLKRKKQ